VSWTGPGYNGDFIGIGRVGKMEQPYLNYVYTAVGNPVDLQLPTEAGDYEIKYFVGQGEKVLVKVPICISAATAMIEGPEEAIAGSTIEVSWTGPGYNGDFIGIGRVGKMEQPYLNYVYTNVGNPVDLQLPTEAGDYEIKYFVGQGEKVLVKAPICISAATAMIEGPEEASAGSTIEVSWTGPGYNGDFIGIGRVGKMEQPYSNYVYTNVGNPVDLQLPTEAGDYEIKYFVGQGEKVLVKVPICISAVTAMIEGPEQAIAGSTIAVSWTGPGYNGDFIGIGRVGKKEQPYLNYVYTAVGNPVDLQLPTEAGDYEIKYFVGQGEKVLVKVPIHLDAP